MGCEQSCLLQDKHRRIASESTISVTSFMRTNSREKRDEQTAKNPDQDIPLITISQEQKTSLQSHYRQTMLEQRPDIFHKTMLMCMQSSPKLNEIIACQMYCYRDLTKWPKLNNLCQAQLNFYDRLINIHKLDEYAIAEAVYSLGVVHYRYAQYGLKPHFLDMWQLNLEMLAGKLKFVDDSQKQLFLESLRVLTSYVTSVMNLAYSRCQMSQMVTQKLFAEDKEKEECPEKH